MTVPQARCSRLWLPCERIRQDCPKADPRVKRVFTLLELRLLETGLDAEQVWKEARGGAAPGVLSLAVRHIFPVGRDR